MKINCEQFSELLTFYLNNELSDNLKKAFENHLTECKDCSLRYEMLHSVVDELKHIYDEIIVERDEADDKVQELIDDEIEEKHNLALSAYIDNELNDEYSVKVRKAIIAKPKVRNKIEKLYKIQKCLKNSYIDGQNKSKKDYSKLVLKELNICNYNGKTFYCVLLVIFILVLVFLSVMVIINII